MALVATHRHSTKNLNIKSENIKSKMAAVAILKIHKLHYLGHLPTDLLKLDVLRQIRMLYKTFIICIAEKKIQDGRRRHIEFRVN